MAAIADLSKEQLLEQKKLLEEKIELEKQIVSEKKVVEEEPSKLKTRLFGRTTVPSVIEAAIRGQGQEELSRLGEQSKESFFGMVEGITGGIPRGLVEKAIGRELDIRGNIGGRIAGAVVGLPKTAAIGGAKLAVRLGAKTGGVVSTILAGAAGAAVAAPEVTKNPFDPLQRATAATIGALGGLFIGGMIKAISIYKAGKVAVGSAQQALDIDGQLLQITKDLELAKTKTGKFARQGALAVQKRYRKFSSTASEGYENLLDKVQKNLPKRIKKNDIVDLLENSIDEAVADGLDTGPVFKELVRIKDNLIELQKPTLTNIFKGVKSGETVNASDLRKAFTESSAIEEITLKELIKIKRLIRQKMTSGFVKGSQRADADDVPGNIFLQKMGQFTEKFSPELKSANQVWAKVVQTQKKAVKIFKPGQGPLETKSGTDFIKKAAKGELEGGEALFLKRLQNGIKPFTPGVGNVVSKAEIEVSKTAALEIQQADLQGKLKKLEKILSTKNAGKLQKFFRTVTFIGERVLLYKLLRKLPFLGS